MRGTNKTVVQETGAYQTETEGDAPNARWKGGTNADTEGNVRWAMDTQELGGTNLRREVEGTFRRDGTGEGTAALSDGTRAKFSFAPDGSAKTELNLVGQGTFLSESRTTRREIPTYAQPGETPEPKFESTTVTTVKHPDGKIETTTVTMDANGGYKIETR